MRPRLRSPVEPCPLPECALLARYSGANGYVDCYVVDVDAAIDLPCYVEAFYTTAAFQPERWLLALAGMPSTDVDAAALGRDERDRFAAWHVEARADDQLLLADVHGRTRSWLMCAPVTAGHGTRLWFGSAVVPTVDTRTGSARMGWVFRALLGFHRRYSRFLLGAAARALRPRPTRRPDPDRQL